MQTCKYDAFISYRHTEPDKTIAEKLHRMLETYRVPKAVVKMGSQKKVGRVFRDREELPTSSNLAESIQEALENSEHLVVICSPRTPDSQWVCKEIETFAALHGHDRILALLIEGEPEESFPEQLRFVKKKLVLEDGTVTETVQEVEPLAADIRAENIKGMKKKLKTEVLRLLAPILNCRFDDLRQRHKERRIKRALAFSLALSAFLLLFGSYSAFQAALIRQQAEVIRQKSEEVEQHAEMLEIQVEKTLRSQSLYLADLALTYLESGDRLGAVLVAREALPKDLANLERPYVEEAEYALCEALGIYKTHLLEIMPDLFLRHNAAVLDVALSPGGKKVATRTDSSEMIYFWDAENGMLINTYTLSKYAHDVHFLDDHIIILATSDGVYSLNIDTLAEKCLYAGSWFKLTVSPDRSKAALLSRDLVVLDVAEGKPVMELSLQELFPEIKYVEGSNAVFDENGTCLFFTIDDGRIVKVNLVQNQVERVYPAAYDYIVGIAAGPDGRLAVISFGSEANESYSLKVYDASGNTLFSMTTNDSIYDPAFAPWDNDKLIYTTLHDLVILDIRDGSKLFCACGGFMADYHLFQERIITVSNDGSMRFWDTEGAEIPLTRQALNIPVVALDFAPGMFAVQSKNEIVILRPFKNSNALLLDGRHTSIIDDVVCLDGGRYLVSASHTGCEIFLWDIESKKAIASIHTDAFIRDLCAVDGGSKLLVLTGDGKISLYDTATLNLICEEDIRYVYELITSPDGSLCYLDALDARIINTSNLETVASFSEPFLDAVFFNDNSKIILGASSRLSIFDISGQSIIKEIEVREPAGLRLSHDNTMLACISEKRSVKLFDANSLEEKFTLDFAAPRPEAVFIDPSGQTLFIYFSDDTLGRYDVTDGKLIGMLDKKIRHLKDILFSQDRNIYITIGLDGYIWHAETHKPIGHVSNLYAADLESGRLYTDYYSGLLALSLFDTQMLLDEAERQLKGRTLTPEEKKRLFIVE